MNIVNIEFDSEPVYRDNDKYIKTKMKIYEDRVCEYKFSKQKGA